MDGKQERVVYDSEIPVSADSSHEDVFGAEEHHDIRYKTLTWPIVAILMIAEIVSNGMLSLPSSLASVGIVPGLVIIVFLGVFATYTAWLLVNFKLRHPDVHTMGDAGYILAGPVVREMLAFGTVIFAILGTSSVILTGQLALSALSDNALCSTLFAGIFTIPILLCAFPRTLHGLGWVSIPSVISITVAGIVCMIGAGLNPVQDREIDVAVSASFYTAFNSITSPVFAYAGHFMFFIIISEMREPQHAMKAAYTLQIFSTTMYVIFAAVVYAYIGSTVASPAFGSLPPLWQKASYGIAIPNFLIAGSLYSHTAAKLVFVRIFRRSKHLHSHTVLGWSVWALLLLVMCAVSFLFAVGVPIFNYLIGITAALFASQYTYGIAGLFWLHDSYHDKGGVAAWRRRPVQFTLCVLTFLAGVFICVAGMYVSVKGVADAYANGTISPPFAC